MDEKLRNEIIGIYKQENYKQKKKIDNFYMFEDILPKKLENALSSYAQSLGTDETVIFHYDDTVGGSAKEGFILTTKHLYCKNLTENGDRAYIPNINNITIKHRLFYSTIIVGMDTRNDIKIDVMRNKKKSVVLINILDQTIRLIKKQKLFD